MSSDWEMDYRYEPRPLFEHRFRCLPFRSYKNPELETGDKIIMPPSALSEILSLPIQYPLLFKIQSFNTDKISHCGVLEFEAEEGCVHVPEWMMKNLNIQEGGDVVLSSSVLSKGFYVKLQPHATSFMELSDPRAVLEKTMRGFTCLSRGDSFMIRHNGVEFYMDVLVVMPGDAVSLIETDCEVEFATPLDYVEPHTEDKVIKTSSDDGLEKEEQGVKYYRAFAGKGRRLDGNAVAESGGTTAVIERKSGEGKFKAFTGRGRTCS